MAARKSAKAQDESFEVRLAKLQTIVNRLEDPTLPLEESINLYKEGLTLSTACREQLEKARHDVRVLTEEGRWAPFDSDTEEE